MPNKNINLICTDDIIGGKKSFQVACRFSHGWSLCWHECNDWKPARWCKFEIGKSIQFSWALIWKIRKICHINLYEFFYVLTFQAAPIPRQEENERPYEYIPRVFHSLRKIIKGVLNGSIHEVFHGSFSFAPKEVSNEIIGIYNQVVGFPDQTEAPFNATLEELLEEFEEEEEARA